jgi:hypothetical protein
MSKNIIKLALLVGLCLPVLAFAEGTEIHISVIDDIWATLKNYFVPICAGMAIIGAFISDHFDAQSSKKGFITIACILLFVKFSVAALAWIKMTMMGI